jgi:hypothetical protein
MVDTQSVDTKAISPTERLIPVEKKLVKDFYLSFKFSQGDAALQEKLMEFLLLSYTPEEQTSLRNPSISLKSAITALKVPKTHIFIHQDIQEDEFVNQWRNFREAAFRMRGQQPDKERSIEPLVEEIARRMVSQENRWMLSSGRENRAQYKEDEFESYIRTLTTVQKI